MDGKRTDVEPAILSTCASLTVRKASAGEASKHFVHHGGNGLLVHIFLRGEATKDAVVGKGPAHFLHACPIVDLDLASFRVGGDDGHKASLLLVALDGTAADRHLEERWGWGELWGESRVSYTMRAKGVGRKEKEGVWQAGQQE